MDSAEAFTGMPTSMLRDGSLLVLSERTAVPHDGCATSAAVLPHVFVNRRHVPVCVIDPPTTELFVGIRSGVALYTAKWSVLLRNVVSTNTLPLESPMTFVTRSRNVLPSNRLLAESLR